MFLKITIIYQNNNNNNVKPPKLGLMEKMQLRHKTKISSPGPSLVVQSLRLHAYSVNEKETGRYFTGEHCFIKGIFAFAYTSLKTNISISFMEPVYLAFSEEHGTLLL